MDGIVEIFSLALPTIIMGFVAYYFFNLHIKNVNNQNKLAEMTAKKKESLPIKLQAYERMTLFCERINPIKMLVRIKPVDQSTEDYLQLLLKSIEQEFEHNMVQQIYISDECWNVIIASKTATIKKLQQVASTSSNSQDYSEKMMLEFQNTRPASETAIAFIKNEVKKLV